MIALDIETTGLSEKKNSMVSIGAVHIETGKDFYKECRIYEDSEISDKALEINGFTKSQLTDESKPLPHVAYAHFYDWCLSEIGNMPSQEGEELLIGQNLPSFDVRFLKYYHYNVLGNNSKWPFGHRYLDLHTYVFAKTGKSQSHDDTLEMLGLPKETKPHNALNGAKVVSEIYKNLSE